MSPEAWEATLVALMRAPDPGAALDALLGEPGHDPCLDAIDRDGLVVAARVVMCVRLDRLLGGDAEAALWHRQDVATFAPTFKHYHLDVPPRAYTPGEEAESWREWLTRGLPADVERVCRVRPQGAQRQPITDPRAIDPR